MIALSSVKYHVSQDVWRRTFKPLWLAAALLNSCYSYYWDVERDWEIGFFSQVAPQRSLAPRPALPPALLYRRGFYLYLMASNAALRCAWTYKLSPHLRRNHLAVCAFVLMEAFRCGSGAGGTDWFLDSRWYRRAGAVGSSGPFGQGGGGPPPPPLPPRTTILQPLSPSNRCRRFQWVFVRVEVELRKLQAAKPELGMLVPAPQPGLARGSDSGDSSELMLLHHHHQGGGRAAK